MRNTRIDMISVITARVTRLCRLFMSTSAVKQVSMISNCSRMLPGQERDCLNELTLIMGESSQA
jgi:hypothetical protein